MTAGPALAGESDALVFVVDESGSLAGVDGSHAATAGLSRAVQQLDDDSPVGILGFGYRCEGEPQPSDALAVPVRPQQREVLAERIDDLRVNFGDEDPVLAARQAVAALAPYGGGTIVLVTDAAFDCTEPAEGWCRAVADVVPEGYVVMPVGYNTVDQQLLDCLARATGGTVALADDLDDLTDAIVGASESGSGSSAIRDAAVVAVLAAAGWFVVTHTSVGSTGQEQLLRRLVGVTPRPTPPVQLSAARSTGNRDDRALDLRARRPAWRWITSTDGDEPPPFLPPGGTT